MDKKKQYLETQVATLTKMLEEANENLKNYQESSQWVCPTTQHPYLEGSLMEIPCKWTSMGITTEGLLVHYRQKGLFTPIFSILYKGEMIKVKGNVLIKKAQE